MAAPLLDRLWSVLEPAVRRQAHEALAARRALLDAALDAVVVIDAASTVKEWNAAAERTFQFTRMEAMGRPMADLIVPPELREAHYAGLRRYLRTGEANVLGRRIEITAVRRDGGVIPVELTITRVPDIAEVVFTAFVRDISQRKRAERSERILSQVGGMFAAPLNSHERARWTADLLFAEMASACVVALADGEAVFRAERGEATDDLRRAAEEAMTDGSSRRDEGGEAVIAVPLVVGRRTLGSLAMRVEVASPQVHDGDLRIAEELALRCALAIYHASTYEQRTRETKVLQRSLVPSEVPQPPGIIAAGGYHAAGDISRIGGDFYEVFALKDGRWAAVVGDVCGKGPQAAAITAKVRHSLRAICDQFALPSQVLARMNELLVSAPNEMCTIALAFITPDDAGADLVLSVGGHPPLLVQDREGRLREAGASGPMLGAFPELAWTDEHDRLSDGERLILYTDGLLEQRRGALRRSVPEQVHERLTLLAGQSAHSLAEQVVGWAVGEQEGNPADDTAVLVLESAGSTVGAQARFERTPSAIGDARAFLGEVCGATPGVEVQPLALALSEIFTNAVRHGRGDSCDVVVRLSPDAVRVEVRADGEAFAVPTEPPEAMAAGGRGLMLVDAVSDRWGVDAGYGRAAVWFAVDRAKVAAST